MAPDPQAAGRHPTVMLIHGLIGSSTFYQPSTHIASAHVLTIDQHGYGLRLDADPASLTLQSQAELIAGALESQEQVWLAGHSMGGAVAWLVADLIPDRIRGIINVEGNFTLKDAFWSRRIAAMPRDTWHNEYESMRQDAAQWLIRCGIDPTPERLDRAHEVLGFQHSDTIHAMSRAIIAETSISEYGNCIDRCLRRKIVVHLIAGARSAAQWDVPPEVRSSARTITQIDDAGHMMMLEQPAAFCRAVDACLCNA